MSRRLRGANRPSLTAAGWMVQVELRHEGRDAAAELANRYGRIYGHSPTTLMSLAEHVQYTKARP